MFKKYQNENQIDRTIRLVLGIVLALTGYAFFSGTLQIVLYVLAFIALFTSEDGSSREYPGDGVIGHL